MGKASHSSTAQDAIIDIYIGFAVYTALIQVAYMTIVGSFPFNSFLSGVLASGQQSLLFVSVFK